MASTLIPDSDVRRVYELAADRYALSPDGARLVRLRADGFGKPLVRGVSSYQYVVIEGARYCIRDIAYILRHGPDATMPKDGKKQRRLVPIDGDWSNLHPGNWRESRARGTEGRAAARRAREAALAAGFVQTGLRLYANTADAITEPAAWWARVVSRWGDTQPALSVPWQSAREHEDAARWWALMHHVADWCRQALESGKYRNRPSEPIGDVVPRVRAAGDAELLRVALSPGDWARVASVWLTTPPITLAPPDGMTHHEQHQDAADELY